MRRAARGTPTARPMRRALEFDGELEGVVWAVGEEEEELVVVLDNDGSVMVELLLLGKGYVAVVGMGSRTTVPIGIVNVETPVLQQLSPQQ
jgi:hypothetical protein